MALQTFTDVAPGDTFYHVIEAIYAAGITVGTSATTFSPSTAITNGQALAFCTRSISWLLNSEDPVAASKDIQAPQMFNDVDLASVYFGAVQKAAKLGIVGGTALRTDYDTGEIDVAVNLTREQMVVFVVRALDLQAPATPTDDYPEASFSDVATGRWSYWYVEKARELGITAGTSATTFSPTSTVPREQMAAFIVAAFDVPLVTGANPDDVGA